MADLAEMKEIWFEYYRSMLLGWIVQFIHTRKVQVKGDENVSVKVKRQRELLCAVMGKVAVALVFNGLCYATRKTTIPNVQVIVEQSIPKERMILTFCSEKYRWMVDYWACCLVYCEKWHWESEMVRKSGSHLLSMFPWMLWKAAGLPTISS